jgi:hypothetical protein
MKPYEEVCFPSGILRWIREGDEYVCRLTEDQMRQIKELHETPYTKTYSGGKPNYTEPKEWVGLTEDEAADFVLFHAVVDEECIRAIEAKLKEKNT